MSIFSRLRKRDADEPVAPSPGADAKVPAGSSPDAKPAAAAAEPKVPPPREAVQPAPTQEEPNEARKAARAGTTRVYEAAKPGAVPAARHAVPVSTAPASASGLPVTGASKRRRR